MTCRHSKPRSSVHHKKPDTPSKSCLCCDVTIPYWILVGYVTTTILFYGLLQQRYKLPFIFPSTVETVPYEVQKGMGLDGVMMFQQHDKNQDGFIDAMEFKPLGPSLNQSYIIHKYDLPSTSSDELVTLEAYFTPIRLSLEETPFALEKNNYLKQWKSVHKKSMKLATRHFGSWMQKTTTFGKVYDLLPIQPEMYQGIVLSNNRYLPPTLSQPADILLHEVLSMWHPCPIIMNRHEPFGAVAVIRAMNAHTVDIVFRIHAEFQISEPPYNPFWVTPAQFTGHLTIDRDASHVHKFQLFVPNNKDYNVGIEWIKDDKNDTMTISELAYLPEMSINISKPSSLEKDKAVEANRDIEWTNEISVNKAVELLLFEYYRGMEMVKFFHVIEAFDAAAREYKLVHHIILFGSLVQQSCTADARKIRDEILGSEPVVSMLENFISTWSSNTELLIQGKSERERRILQMQIQEYEFPLTVVISFPNGTVISSGRRKDFTNESNGYDAKSRNRYRSFLEKAIYKANAEPHPDFKTEL